MSLGHDNQSQNGGYRRWIALFLLLLFSLSFVAVRPDWHRFIHEFGTEVANADQAQHNHEDPLGESDHGCFLKLISSGQISTSEGDVQPEVLYATAVLMLWQPVQIVFTFNPSKIPLGRAPPSFT